ncbi:MAG: microcystin LR degradation protein MlrC, partial [Spirochaetia bacterium]|nr:microcystin LR degradation protein MlrC [Spirochaetia bacterium]
VDVILTANRCALVRPRIFEKLGLDINSYRFVVVKLGYLYPELAEVSERTILALTKGTSTERLQDMDLKRITRPVFPLDTDFIPQW